jgi:hypothetical protein
MARSGDLCGQVRGHTVEAGGVRAGVCPRLGDIRSSCRGWGWDDVDVSGGRGDGDRGTMGCGRLRAPKLRVILLLLLLFSVGEWIAG